MVSRIERVIISAESNLTGVAAKDAAAVAALRRELGGLDGTNVDAARSNDRVTDSVNRQGDAFRQQTSSINQFSGRLRLLTEAAVIGGPAIVAMGAVAVPAVTGLAAAFGFAAIGAGTMIAGFQGVGDAFTALNKAQLEPTAANLEAARVAMENLSPAAQSMVGDIDRLGPALTMLRDASAEGISPQMSRGVDNLIAGLPKLRTLFEETAGAATSVLADGAGILTADRWQPFLQFLEDEAPDAILQLGRSTGDLAFGFAELFRNLSPMNNNVLDFIEKAADGFANWSSGLESSQGLRNFMSYLRETGPQVGEALASMSTAIIEISKAAAPLSGPVLSAITGISNAIATVASSDAGAPLVAAAAAALALNRALKITTALAAAPAVASLFGGGAKAGAASKASAAGPIGLAVGAALLATPQIIDAVDQYDGLNQSVDQLATTLGKGEVPAGLESIRMSSAWLGDRSGFDTFQDNIDRTLGTSYGKLKEADTQVKALDDSLTQIAATEGPEAASKAFDDLRKNLGLSLEDAGQLKSQLPGFIDAVGSRSIGDMLGLFEDIPGAIDRATASANSFKAALAGAATVLTRRQGRRDYEASIDAATAALKENGKTLDENTPKGRANAQALDTMAVSAVAVARGMRGANKVEFMKGARAQFIDTAMAMGKTAEGARNLADKLGLIKPVKAKVSIADAAAKAALKAINAALDEVDGKNAKPKLDLVDGPIKSALRAINAALDATDKKRPRPTADLNDGPFNGKNRGVMNALNVTDRFTANPTATLRDNATPTARGIQAALAAIQSKTVTVTVVNRTINKVQNVVSGVVNGLFGAEGMIVGSDGKGSMVQTFAQGGMDRGNAHNPEFAGPGPTRVWREPETGGESYIPHAADHRRPRAKSILEQTAGLFGGEVQWFAEGGINGRSGDGKGGGDGLGRAANNAARSLKGFERRLKESEKALEREKKQRDAAIEKRNELASTITTSLRSDIFAQPESVWGGSAGDPLSILRQDIRSGREMESLSRQLRRRGLDGKAFASITSLSDAQTLSQYSRSELNQFERLYQQRNRVTNAAGDLAGNVGFGKLVAVQSREAAALKREVVRLRHAVKRAEKSNERAQERNSREVTKGINGAASSANRRAGRRIA